MKSLYLTLPKLLTVIKSFIEVTFLTVLTTF